jgi:hypothetical protein
MRKLSVQRLLLMPWHTGDNNFNFQLVENQHGTFSCLESGYFLILLEWFSTGFFYIHGVSNPEKCYKSDVKSIS